MRRGLRAPRAQVTRDIQALVRSFPSEHMRIVRRAPAGSTSIGDVLYDEVTVFEGEGIFIPLTGLVSQYGLGQVEDDAPQLLIAGWWDIQQGDLYTREAPLPGGKVAPPRVYQILYPPDAWQSFTHAMLKNFGQGT